MGLRIRQLKFIAEDIVKNQRLLEALREEVRGALGCLINISEGLDEACYQVNDALDVAKAKGNLMHVSIKTALLKKLIESNSDEARKLAARLLPENLIINYRFDKNPEIRAEVCRRLPTKFISEVVEAYPGDYEVAYIFEQKKSKDDERYLNLYNDKRIGDLARPEFQPELSDTWYRDRAQRFLDEYGTNIEYQWEEVLVRRYCASVKATSGVQIDEKKLYDAVMDLILEKEEESLLKDEKKRVNKLEKIRESYEPKFFTDDLKVLLQSSQSSQNFILQVNEKFSIKESQVPAGLRKYTVGAGFSVPMKATIPGGKLTHLVESILDTYVSKWNEIQSMKGEPLSLNWDADPLNEGKISFRIVLR